MGNIGSSREPNKCNAEFYEKFARESYDLLNIGWN